jgi:Ras-related protein Rab-8A
VVVVFDQTDPKSFEKIKYWIGEIKANAPETVSIMLAGNKSDLVRVVRREAAEEVASSLSVEYVETSAKTGDSVNECVFSPSFFSFFGGVRRSSRSLTLSSVFALC